MSAPIADARLREIAAREYGPNRQEGAAMAKELLALRAAVRALAAYTAGYPAIADPQIAAGIARAAAAAGSGRAAPAVGVPFDPAPGARVRVTSGTHAGFVGTLQPREDGDNLPEGWHRVRRDAEPCETRLFEARYLEPVDA